jgi:hypothetical protein
MFWWKPPWRKALPLLQMIDMLNPLETLSDEVITTHKQWNLREVCTGATQGFNKTSYLAVSRVSKMQ